MTENRKNNVNSAKDERKAGKNNGNTVEVVFILDRSGSMSGLEADTIGGFNSTLRKQREEGGNVIWSTVLFDDRYEVIHNRVPIDKVKELTEKEYYVRGCTALLDAVGKTIHHIAHVHKELGEWDAPDKTLIVITTDGMENASREYTYHRVRSMISKEQEKHGWEFLFLGANMDAVSEAGRIGICADRAATYLNDEEGIAKNYEAVGCAMGSMVREGSICANFLDDVRADFEARRKK